LPPLLPFAAADGDQRLLYRGFARTTLATNRDGIALGRRHRTPCRSVFIFLNNIFRPPRAFERGGDRRFCTVQVTGPPGKSCRPFHRSVPFRLAPMMESL
jgi:hypothetical protein